VKPLVLLSNSISAPRGRQNPTATSDASISFRRDHPITDSIAPELQRHIGGIIRAEKCVLLTVGGMADHVHLLISISREISLAELVRVDQERLFKVDAREGIRDFVW